MKIIFISDLHGLIDNLKKIIPIIDTCDKLVVLGDSFAKRYDSLDGEFNPKFIIDYFNKNADKIIHIKGNCDYVVTENDLDFPLHNYYEMEVDNQKLKLIHAPDDITSLYSDDILIYGHTHRAEKSYIDGNLYLNPGSLSLPKEGVPSYMIYDNNFIIYDLEGNIIY